MSLKTILSQNRGAGGLNQNDDDNDASIGVEVWILNDDDDVSIISSKKTDCCNDLSPTSYDISDKSSIV